MQSHKTAAHSGSSLASRAAAVLPEITRTVLTHASNEAPVYGSLPTELLEGDIAGIIAWNLRAFLRGLNEGRPPDEAELAEVTRSAAQRAQERVPLDAMLTAYHIGADLGWQALVELAGPDDTQELLDAGTHILRYLRAVIPAVALAYSQEHQLIHGEERQVRHQLITALLAGNPASEHAHRAGTTIAPSYVVLDLRLPAPSVPPEPGAEIAARRLTHRVHAELEAHAPGRILADLDGGGGIVLVPATPDTTEPVAAELPGLVERIGMAIALPITAALSVASGTAGIPDAAREAREVATLVHRLGHGPGTYRLDDVLLEYQLSRPGAGLRKLAAKLDVLVDKPYLLDTVRAVVVHGHNRSQAAAELHVHRNTLEYRLQRVAAMTGLDAGDPEGARLLGAALTARDLLG